MTSNYNGIRLRWGDLTGFQGATKLPNGLMPVREEPLTTRIIVEENNVNNAIFVAGKGLAV
jgi:hypothetical protein